MENVKSKPPGPGETPEQAAPAEGEGAPNLKLHVSAEERSLDFVLDVPLKISVELGRTRILVQDLLKLHKGSVIELSKLAGEPLEILVNERVLAKGEVIVVN